MKQIIIRSFWHGFSVLEALNTGEYRRILSSYRIGRYSRVEPYWSYSGPHVIMDNRKWALYSAVASVPPKKGTKRSHLASYSTQIAASQPCLLLRLSQSITRIAMMQQPRPTAKLTMPPQSGTGTAFRPPQLACSPCSAVTHGITV